MFSWISQNPRRWRMKTRKPFGKGSTGSSLRLSLGSINPVVAEALASAFHDVAAAEVLEGNLLDAGCEAIVSPANSFGDMGGGIDKAIDDFHQGEAQRAVVAAIAEYFFGELPVGMALVVELPARRLPFLVVSPTMRVPGRLPRGLNAYLAMRAALVAVRHHNARAERPIKRLAIPGLCTGIGGMPAEDSAEQMRVAYDSVIGEQWRHVVYPGLAPYALRD